MTGGSSFSQQQIFIFCCLNVQTVKILAFRQFSGPGSLLPGHNACPWDSERIHAPTGSRSALIYITTNLPSYLKNVILKWYTYRYDNIPFQFSFAYESMFMRMKGSLFGRRGIFTTGEDGVRIIFKKVLTMQEDVL